MLVHLDLFSGIGGFALACQWAGIPTICFVENDQYCQKVLRKHWPGVPIVGDIRDVEKIKEIVANATGKGLSNRRGASLANAGAEKPELERCSGLRSGIQGNAGGIITNSNSHGIRTWASRNLEYNGDKLGEYRPAKRETPEMDDGKQRTESPAILVTAGFPCQPFSVAGKRQGEGDDRYLWPETLAVIKAIKPKWVLLENVTGIINLALDTVLSDLEGAGYSTETLIIPACAVNAWHRRDRIWIVANLISEGLEKWQEQNLLGQFKAIKRDSLIANAQFQSGNLLTDSRSDKEIAEQKRQDQGTGAIDGSSSQDAADTKQEGLERGKWNSSRGEGQGFKGEQHNRDKVGCSPGCPGGSRGEGADWWAVEPELGRVAHGIPNRVDRLKCLGNAIVPPLCYEIIKVIADYEDNSLPNQH